MNEAAEKEALFQKGLMEYEKGDYFEAHEAWEEENAEHSKTLLHRASLSEKTALSVTPLVLHGDNGSPLKAGTVLATMQQLGITASHSRPRVSNDNPHAEALFRTAKYHPSLPSNGFPCLKTARE